jgi:hypothetical protein
MIKLFSIVLFISALLNFQPRKNNTGNPTDNNKYCNVENTAFTPGEKLTYKIYYNWGFVWLPAGEVVFDVKENKENYLYTAVGKTFPAYNWIYEVEDYFYSYVDKKTLLPVRAKRNITEGGYRIINDIKFDQTKKEAQSYVKINDKQPETYIKKYDSCMFDILSVIYSLRNTDKSGLKKGDQIPFDMMLDDEIYPLKLEYTGNKKLVKVKNLGKYDAVLISPSVIKGRVFSENERMKVWISNDKNNIPLIIESPLAVGNIKVILQKYEGLRYPLLFK